MKSVFRAVFQYLVIVGLLALIALLTASTLVVQPAAQAAPAAPLSDADVLVAGAIAAAAGWAFSYMINTFTWLSQLFDKVPSANKPVVLAAFYIVVAVALAQLTCFSIYTSGVACPANATDYVRLIFLALVAWASSQTAHATGGKQLAAVSRYKLQSPPNTPAVG